MDNFQKNLYMSKPKNRAYCPESGKPKILFETESKANTFIKFNSNDIENGESLRPYYCISCGGYHVSSKPIKRHKISRSEKVIALYKDMKDTRQRLLEMETDDNNETIATLLKIMKNEMFLNKKDVKMFLNQQVICEKYSSFVIKQALKQ